MIAEKQNKLTNEQKRQFQTMPEDPVLDVAENNGIKINKG